MFKCGYCGAMDGQVVESNIGTATSLYWHPNCRNQFLNRENDQLKRQCSSSFSPLSPSSSASSAWSTMDYLGLITVFVAGVTAGIFITRR